MDAKLIVDIPAINWACTYLLDAERVHSAGRGKHNAVEIPDMGTSDRHVEFYFSRGSWYVRDLGGEGGLRVNGRIVQESPIVNGDDIRVGNSQLTFETETEEQDEDWKRTAELMKQESARLQESLDAAPAQLESPTETAAVPESDATPLGLPKAPAAPARPKVLTPLVRKADDQSRKTDDSADDLVWVSRKMASLLEEVLSRPASLEFVLQRMLMGLRSSIDADYGFLMLPDAQTGRWVVRTQVGDALSWSGYERAHPVPLSVATTAFKRKRVISNAMEDDDTVEDVGPSASMIALRVNGYVAVPLFRGDSCRGVLYFDTRNGDKEFRSRDVKLLTQAGATIVEIEDRKHGT